MAQRVAVDIENEDDSDSNEDSRESHDSRDTEGSDTDESEDEVDDHDVDDYDTGYHPSWMDRFRDLTFKDSFIFFYENTEIICYVIFLICFTTMAILGRTVSHYSFTQSNALRVTLTQSMYHADLEMDIGDIDDIYRFFDEVILPVVFKEEMVNGSFIKNQNLRYWVNENNARVLGGVRIKQSRWKKEPCKIDSDMFELCYDPESGQSRDPFSGNGHWALVPFEYWDSSVLEDQLWTGKFGSYPGGGYVIDLLVTQGRKNASLILNEMRDGEWIDAGTRALFVDFTVFDPSTLLHTVARVAFEMPTGGVFATTEIKTWKFLRYESGAGTALAAFHVIFLLYIVGFTIQMGFEMYSEGVISLFAGDTMTSYWSKSQWRKIEVVNMILFYTLLGLFVRNDFYMRNLISLTSTTEFHSYRSLQFLFLGEVLCQAIAGFFLFLKAFKYLQQFKQFKFFYGMFDSAASHLLVFFLILFVFFSSFAMLGFLFFGSDLSDFRSFWSSVANMIRYTVSDMDYSSLTSSSRALGSFFWFGWTTLMILVLVNVFVGIIGQAYKDAQEALLYEEEEEAEDKSEKVINIIQRFGAARIDELDDDGDGQISAKELAQIYPITVDEARAFIAHFDVDGDGELDQEEFQKLIEEQMTKKDEERKKKEAEAEEKKRKIRERELEHIRAEAMGKTMTKEDFLELKDEMSNILQLLELTLNTTVDGSRAVKRVLGIKPKQRHDRRKSTLTRLKWNN